MSPVVLIHGMWSHPNVADPLRKRLVQRGHDVHAPALPGHDPRRPIPAERLGRLSVRDYALGIRRYIEKQRFDRPPVLVGHSMGGLIAQMVATRVPVESVVLLNSAGPAGVNHINLSAARSSLNVLGTPGFWNRPHFPPFDRARYALFNEVDPATARGIHATLLPESGRCYAEIVFWALDPGRATRIRGSIRAPMLIVSSGRDRIVHPSVSRRLAQRYPGARFRLYPKNGHWLFHEPGSDRIFEGVADWIDDRAATATPAPTRRFILEATPSRHESVIDLESHRPTAAPLPPERAAGLDRAVDDARPLRGDADENAAPDRGSVLPR